MVYKGLCPHHLWLGWDGALPPHTEARVLVQCHVSLCRPLLRHTVIHTAAHTLPIPPGAFLQLQPP